MVRKETVIDSWKSVRQDTAQAVEDFPAAELDFKATADLMSFGELGRHILDAGHALATARARTQRQACAGAKSESTALCAPPVVVSPSASPGERPRPSCRGSNPCRS